MILWWPYGDLILLDEHQILSIDFHQVLNAATPPGELVVWVHLSHYQSWFYNNGDHFFIIIIIIIVMVVLWHEKATSAS